ncbi:RASEF protein, partial [Jacana jacana]|nr:RASEF protein [Jacana jacana]
WGPCHEDAVALQGVAGPVGDGGGEPGSRELRQDAAVCPILARQQCGQLGMCSCPGWGGAIAVGTALPWVGPLLSMGFRMLPPTRTMNRTLYETNISLRSALLLSRDRDMPVVSPVGLTPEWAGKATSSTHLGWEGQGCWVLATPTGAGALTSPACIPGSGGHSTQVAPSTQIHRAPKAGGQRALGSNSPEGEAEGPPGSAGRFSKRKLPAFAPEGCEGREEPAPPCPMYRLVLTGDGGTGKSSFLLRLCRNEFRGDISSTLGVDFQIKQLLVDGEQTTLQIWDTAGQ